MNEKIKLENQIYKDEKGFKKFLMVKNYGNLVVGFYKFDSENDCYFEHENLHFYRVKYQHYEKYLQKCLNKSN